MNKYIVDYKALEDVNTNILIEAVARYLSVEEFPSINVVAAILGIEKVEKTNG